MTNTEQTTIEYYNQRSEQFTSTTVDLEFSDIQDRFLKYLPEGSLILDYGCGAGRDSRYFIQKGYSVEAIDGSAEMVRIASKTAGIPVKQMLFGDLEETEKYDGIWACASILHVPFAQMADIYNRMYRALKENGILYVSYKYGDFEGLRNSRYFTDFTEEKFADFLKTVPALTVLEQWVSGDARPGRSEEKWLNVILRKG